MIARIWHGMTPATKAEAYLDFLNQSGVPDYQATPGNRGVPLSRRGGQSEDQVRPAGIQGRPAAGRRRHATSAAPDRRAERRDDDPAGRR